MTYVKIFERLLYNKILNFFITNHLISTNQSGLSPNTLASSITHGIWSSFDEEYDFQDVFLDISKVFDKICYEGPIFKFK